MGLLAALSRINSPSGRGKQALGLLLQHSPFLQFMETHSGWELDATKFNWQPEDLSAKTIAARTIGAGAQSAAQNIAITDLVADILAAYNANFDVDASYVADVERKLANMDAYMLKELRRRIRQLAIYLENECFLGTGSDGRMKGLKVILDGTTALPGYTGVTRVEDAQIITGGSTKSCDLTVRTNDDKFIGQLRHWISKVPGCAGILCSPAMGALLDTIARTKYAAGETRDLFGKPVTTFNGTPIVPVLDTSITNDEPDNTTPTALTTTTSLYLVAPGEGSLSLVTNSGLEYTDFDLQEGKQSNREKMEIRLKWKIEVPESVLRIRNFKIA
jgi:hypothetical protein